MPKGRIRIRLKSYDHRIIDECCQKILDSALATGAQVVGPVPLPTKRKLVAVIASPFANKNSQEHFQMLTHMRLIDILESTDKTIDSLMHLELPAGVGIEVRM